MTDSNPNPIDCRIVDIDEVPLRVRLLTGVLQLAVAGASPDVALSALGTAVIQAVASMIYEHDIVPEVSHEVGDEIIDQLCEGLHAAWLMHQKQGATEQ